MCQVPKDPVSVKVDYPGCSLSVKEGMRSCRRFLTILLDVEPSSSLTPVDFNMVKGSPVLIVASHK